VHEDLGVVRAHCDAAVNAVAGSHLGRGGEHRARIQQVALGVDVGDSAAELADLLLERLEDLGSGRQVHSVHVPSTAPQSCNVHHRAPLRQTYGGGTRT
jgi:hypothetical protein